MITDDDKRRFEAIFGGLDKALLSLGLGEIKYEPDNVGGEGTRYWAKLPTWDKVRPSIALWCGDWFGEGANGLWVGFEGKEKEIADLLEVVIKERIGQVIDFEDLQTDKKWTSNQIEGVVIHEQYESVYYLGIYFSIRDDYIVIRAPEFVNDVVQAISPPQDVDMKELPEGQTERDAYVRARRGQGQFRSDLERKYGGKCAVTGCAARAVLRASHIKPWRVSKPHERLDKHNGLLLSANVDALFDRSLISFNEKGNVIVGSDISPEDRELLKVDDMRLLDTPMEEQREYLRYHNSLVRKRLSEA